MGRLPVNSTNSLFLEEPGLHVVTAKKPFDNNHILFSATGTKGMEQAQQKRGRQPPPPKATQKRPRTSESKTMTLIGVG